MAAAIARREPEFASSELGRRWVRTANGAGTPVRA
jgi:hypothetical protein